jgi:hypothetical protein
MCNPANLDLTHSELILVVARELSPLWSHVYKELLLTNRKIADIYATYGETRIIIECKTRITQSIIETAYQKYQTQCDYLAIACPPQPVPWTTGRSPVSWPDDHIENVGLWLVDWTGIREVRPPRRLHKDLPDRL